MESSTEFKLNMKTISYTAIVINALRNLMIYNTYLLLRVKKWKKAKVHLQIARITIETRNA